MFEADTLKIHWFCYVWWTFFEKMCISFNGIWRNYKLTTFYISLKPLILLAFRTLFYKKLVFLLMVYMRENLQKSINIRKLSPNFTPYMRAIFILHRKGSFEGHLWLPYHIKRLFYNGFRAKVKWRYEGERKPLKKYAISCPTNCILCTKNPYFIRFSECPLSKVMGRENFRPPWTTFRWTKHRKLGTFVVLS